MLSDEEKKAIEDLKRHIIPFELNGTLLDLIEKQSKEIEKLKKHIQILNNVEFGKFSYDKNYQVKIEAGRQQGKSFRAGLEFSNKIWKDKIKAKIEEVKDGTYDAKIVLQSLLEEE